MTQLLVKGWTEAELKPIRDQLHRILQSAPFAQSRRRQKFLQYIVDESLAGRAERLKAYTIAMEVFERPETFDPLVDPVVRIEAGRLRDKLREYYSGEGRGDPIRIELPKGNYAPVIERLQAAEAELHADQTVADKGDPAACLPATTHFRTAMRWPIVVPAVAMLLLAFAATTWHQRDTTAALAGKPSIAVLPFDNLGNDPQWERFADGMTEDIITDLAHSKDLIVIARNSTEVYRSKPIDIRQIGRDLNVKYVLEGSIQSISERLRVTAQLIDTSSGSHVWSERYDRPVGDLFVVQDEVTQRIAATLSGYEGAVAEAERILIRRKPPANLTAFDTYLLGMEAKHKVTKESLIEAERLFRKALELDPQLARAHVALVDVQFYRIDLGLAPSLDDALSNMMTSGEMAVKLDPDDGKTHYALGLASQYNGKPEQALAEFARAQALAPSDADMLLCIGWSLPGLGQSERAVNLAEQALMLNPHYPDWYNQGLSYVFFFGKQFDKSLKYRLLVKVPLALDYAFLAMANGYLGRLEDAGAAAANVKKLNAAWNAERYLSEGGGLPDAEAELFIEGARKAGLSACGLAETLKSTPSLIRVKSCELERSKASG